MYITFKIDESMVSQLSWMKADSVHVTLVCEIKAIQRTPCEKHLPEPRFSDVLSEEYKTIKYYYEHEMILKVLNVHPAGIVKEQEL